MNILSRENGIATHNEFKSSPCGFFSKLSFYSTDLTHLCRAAHFFPRPRWLKFLSSGSTSLQFTPFLTMKAVKLVKRLAWTLKVVMGPHRNDGNCEVTVTYHCNIPVFSLPRTSGSGQFSYLRAPYLSFDLYTFSVT